MRFSNINTRPDYRFISQNAAVVGIAVVGKDNLDEISNRLNELAVKSFKTDMPLSNAASDVKELIDYVKDLSTDSLYLKKPEFFDMLNCADNKPFLEKLNINKFFVSDSIKIIAATRAKSQNRTESEYFSFTHKYNDGRSVNINGNSIDDNFVKSYPIYNSNGDQKGRLHELTEENFQKKLDNFSNQINEFSLKTQLDKDIPQIIMQAFKFDIEATLPKYMNLATGHKNPGRDGEIFLN